MPRIGGQIVGGAHHGTHEDGGADEISIASLSGESATLATHEADDDIHHAAEVARGRLKSVTTTFLTIPGVKGGWMGTYTLTAERLVYLPMLVHTAITIDQLVLEVETLDAGSSIRMGIYKADVNWQPTDLVKDYGTVSGASTGVKTITYEQALAPGRYLLAIISDGTPTLRKLYALASPDMALITTLGATPYVNYYYKASTYNGLANPGTAWDTLGTTVATPSMAVVFVRVKAP